MYTITGAFEFGSDAEHAFQALHDAGFAMEAGPASDDVPTDGDNAALGTPDADFDVSPTAAASAGAEKSPQTAATGIAVGGAIGLIVGIGALPLLGPAAPLAGAGVGAYGGSLFGALKGLKPADETPASDEDGAADADVATTPVDSAHIERGEGSVITIVAHDGDARTKAVDILWACGATTVVEGE